MRKHLAILHKSAIDAILSGTKLIETRFSKAKIVPFGAVSIGDLVYMKAPGEEIIGQFRVKKVFFFEGLDEKDVEKIFTDYGQQISVGSQAEDEDYFRQKRDSKYGTLIFIGESERFITSPIRFKKSDMRGWVVLE